MISIRYQILLTVILLVGGSLSAYLVFATQFITNDKLAYIYDLNASLAHTRAQEVRARIETLTGEIGLVAASGRSAGPGVSAAGLQSLLAKRNDLVAVELWARRGDEFEKRLELVNEEAQLRLGLGPDRRSIAHQEAGISPDSASRERLLIRNTSQAPDIAMLTMTISPIDRSWVAIADVDPSGLAQVLGNSTLYEVSLVDEQGTVLAHPNRTLTVSRSNLSKRPSVRAALASDARRGVNDVESGRVISAFSRLDLGRTVLVTEVAKSDAMRAATELRGRSLLFGLMAILVTLVVAILVSRRLAQPLRRLERAASAIGSGELGVQADVQSRNEIGALAHSFNKMSTELMRRDEALKHAYRSLQKADRLALLGAVTAGVAHELRNPLTYVLANADWLEEFVHDLPGASDEKAIEDAKQWMGDLQKGLDRINSVVADLGRTSSSRSETELLDVRTVMQDSAKMAGHQIRGRAQIEEHYEPIPEVRANASRLGQVFLNLLINAAQVLPPAKAKTNRIYLRTFLRGADAVVAEVQDNGPGIPVEVADRIFDQFFTTKGNDGGSGLGLAISLSIVEGLGGSIEVDNRPGEGVTFRVVLPLEVPQAALGHA
ncbi:MAG: HAMP domain-containing sensor histidine kinase [Myxococcota bacterium]